MNTSKLQKLIHDNKLTKVQLSERCGISRTTLENVLSGADAKISTIEALAHVLCVPVGYLFDEPAPTATPSTLQASTMVEASEAAALTTQIDLLRQLIEEKDQVIKEKERTIQLLLKTPATE